MHTLMFTTCGHRPRDRARDRASEMCPLNAITSFMLKHSLVKNRLTDFHQISSTGGKTTILQNIIKWTQFVRLVFVKISLD